MSNWDDDLAGIMVKTPVDVWLDPPATDRSKVPLSEAERMLILHLLNESLRAANYPVGKSGAFGEPLAGISGGWRYRKASGGTEGLSE